MHHSSLHAYCIHIQIEKKKVDNFKEGKIIPKFQLSAKFIGEEKSCIEYVVKLLGAKKPNDVFQIDLPVPGMIVS